MIFDTEKILKLHEISKKYNSDTFIFILIHSMLYNDRKIKNLLRDWGNIDSIIDYIKENSLSLDINDVNDDKNSVIKFFSSNIGAKRAIKKIFTEFDEYQLCYQVCLNSFNTYLEEHRIEKSYEFYNLNNTFSLYIDLLKDNKILLEDKDIILVKDIIEELSKSKYSNQKDLLKAMDFALKLDNPILPKEKIYQYYAEFISSLYEIKNDALKITNTLKEQIPIEFLEKKISLNKLNTINLLVNEDDYLIEENIAAKKINIDFTKLKAKKKNINIQTTKLNMNRFISIINKEMIELNEFKEFEDFINISHFKHLGYGIVINHLESQGESKSVKFIKNLIEMVLECKEELKESNVRDLIVNYKEPFLLKYQLEDILPSKSKSTSNKI